MTLAIFAVGLALSWAYWSLVGFFVFDGVTIYVCLFIATLTAASARALSTLQWRLMIAACILIANFAGSHFAWSQASPMTSAAFDVGTAAWFILFGATRWEFGVGAAFLLSAASGVGAGFGLFPPRPPGAFLAWSYPDVTSICGHLANIILGIGAGDAGKRVRDLADHSTLAANYRRGIVSRIYSRSPVVAREAEEDR